MCIAQQIERIGSDGSPLGIDTDRFLARIGIFWHKEMGNFVALTFQKVDATAAAAAFTSPAGSSVIEPELVAAFKDLNVGDAISLPKNQVASERSFKVRVNKAAREALRKLEWGTVGNNYIVRVVEVMAAPVADTANGTAASPEPAKPATK